MATPEPESEIVFLSKEQLLDGLLEITNNNMALARDLMTQVIH